MIEKDELVNMLTSEDVEIRRLCKDYICSNFNIDFPIYYYKENGRFITRVSIDRPDIEKVPYYGESNMSEFLFLLTINYPIDNSLVYSIIDAIIKYNEEFKK